MLQVLLPIAAGFIATSLHGCGGSGGSPTPLPTPSPSSAGGPEWPHTCTSIEGNTTSYNQTRCPLNTTCCASKFSLSLQGCCPWPNAVCCANQLTCCPEGTECVDDLPTGWPTWAVVTTCKRKKEMAAATEAFLNLNIVESASEVQGKCVCKPGAPLPMSTTLKNILVIGDSVSIGYTPSVAGLLADVALVQHAPWSGDGGAEEAAYGVQCLDYWLRSPAGIPIRPDLVFFNFGLHDGAAIFDLPPANVTIPGQEGNMSVYPEQLAQITSTLKTWAISSGAKLLFGVTTPMMNNARADQDIVRLNAAAKQVMTKYSIPTVDMHAAVVKECGPVPQSECFGLKNCFSPHCGGTATHIPGAPSKGYFWLANSTIVPAMKEQLDLQSRIVSM